jgi:hypothetical protein
MTIKEEYEGREGWLRDYTVVLPLQTHILYCTVCKGRIHSVIPWQTLFILKISRLVIG